MVEIGETSPLLTKSYVNTKRKSNPNTNADTDINY
jgi:hypothetical protein